MLREKEEWLYWKRGFFQVSDVRFKQQFQWPLWFLFQTKGSNLVQGYHYLLPVSSFVLLGVSLSLPRVCLCPLLGQQHLSPVTLSSAVLAGDFFFSCCSLSLLRKVFFSSCDPSYEFLFSLSYWYLSISALPNIVLITLPSSSLCFLSTHVFCLIFVPFHISSSYTSFFPFCVILFTLSFSLLSDISLLSTA